MAKQAETIKYAAAISIATLIFFTGLVLGNFTANQKITELDKFEQDLRADSLALELQYDILSENPCGSINHSTLTDELYELGSKLTFMENGLGIDDPDVIRLKEYYSTLQIRHWLLAKQEKNECNPNINLIMYFYTNDETGCDKCDEQGYALTYLRKDNPDIRTYAFDNEIDNVALNTLKQIYFESEEFPVLILNEQTHHGFLDAQQMSDYLYYSTE